MRFPFEIQKQNIKQTVLDIIDTAEARMILGDVVKRLSKQHSLGRKDSQDVIKQLIQANELVYAHEFGHTFVERSFYKPVHITDAIVVKPLDCSYESRADEIVIDLQHGAAFGSGRHPTTRLSLNGLENVLQTRDQSYFADNTTVLDIGTGSGVLVIAAAMMGAGKGLGIDLDPCALAEAGTNVKINGLENTVEISNQPIRSIDAVFSLVMANLRFPTIKQMLPRIYGMTMPGGNILLSGLRVAELTRLKELLRMHRFDMIWESTTHGWAAAAAKKGYAR